MSPPGASTPDAASLDRPIPASPPPIAAATPVATPWSWVLEVLPLFKPRLTALVMVAAASGFYLGAPGALSGVLLLHAVLGTALLSAGASALNQLVERRLDARMERTAGRPIPAGRIRPGEALFLGAALGVIGFLELALAVNLLCALLGVLCLTSYLFAYTPLKRRTNLSTLVGGIPGALPPVMGWAAASGRLDPGAAALFAILFLWQIPHFMAIARLHRDDYARAGFPVLTVTDPDGSLVARAILVNCLALLPAGLLPAWLGITGPVSAVGSLALGAMYLGFGAGAALWRGRAPARRLLLASLIYLPALFLLYILDKA